MNGEHSGFTCGLLRQHDFGWEASYVAYLNLLRTITSDLPQIVEKIVSSHINQTRGMLFTNLMAHNRAFEGHEWVREELGQKKIDVVATPTRGAGLSGGGVIKAEVQTKRGREVHVESSKVSRRRILKEYVIQSLPRLKVS